MYILHVHEYLHAHAHAHKHLHLQLHLHLLTPTSTSTQYIYMDMDMLKLFMSTAVSGSWRSQRLVTASISWEFSTLVFLSHTSRHSCCDILIRFNISTKVNRSRRSTFLISQLDEVHLGCIQLATNQVGTQPARWGSSQLAKNPSCWLRIQPVTKEHNQISSQLRVKQESSGSQYQVAGQP